MKVSHTPTHPRTHPPTISAHIKHMFGPGLSHRLARMAISLKTQPSLGTGACNHCNPSVSVEHGTPLLQDKSHVGIPGVLSCSMYGYAITSSTFNAAAQKLHRFWLHLKQRISKTLKWLLNSRAIYWAGNDGPWMSPMGIMTKAY